MTILKNLIEEDFGIEGNDKWWRSSLHNSLVYNAESDTFFWNSAGIQGDAYVYLTEVRSLDPVSARAYLKNAGGDFTLVTRIRGETEIITYPKLITIFWENLKEVSKDFWYCRTITDSTIDRFQLGYWKGFYTVPITQDSVFRQIILRKDNPKKLIRKYYKSNENYLFNSDILRTSRTVYITESPISAIILEQNGLPAVSHDGGAQGFEKRWFHYFLKVERIIILGDNDQAGRLGAIKTAKILGEDRCKIYCFDDEIEKYGADDWFIDGKSADKLEETVETFGKYTYEYRTEKRRQ